MKYIAVAMLALLLLGCTLPMGVRHQTMQSGNSITFVQENRGGPTVVFESGLGDGLESWSRIYDEVKTFSSVFAYSRPGYSAGINHTLPGDVRTASDSASVLKSVLEAEDVSPPYILVGHSFGGLIVLEFTEAYPDLVAGIVLVDGRVPGFTEACEQAHLSPCLPKADGLNVPLHIAAEINGIRQSERVAPTASQLSAPVVLLVATNPPPGAPSGGQPVWINSQKRYAKTLPDGKLVVVDGSGHYLHRDNPELVIKTIRSLISGP